MIRKRLQLAVLVTVFAGLSSTAFAESSIQVQLIQAEQGKKATIAPELAPLAKTFKRFPGFNQFSLVKNDLMKLKLGEKGVLEAPGGKNVEITYRGVSKGFVKLRFKLGELEMNVRVHNGGVFFHGGFKHENGRLIVAITARSEVLGKAKKAP